MADRSYIYSNRRFIIWCCIFVWFKDTKMATWTLISKFDRTLEYLVNRWGWTWLQNDPDAWRKKDIPE